MSRNLWLLGWVLFWNGSDPGQAWSPIPSQIRIPRRRTKITASPPLRPCCQSSIRPFSKHKYITTTPHAASTTSASLPSDNDSSSSPFSKYQWTRPTLEIALPALIGMMADPLLSMMDTAFVGNVVGNTELAALGACTSIFHLAFNAFRATTTATTSLVARSLQQQPPDNNEMRGQQQQQQQQEEEARHVTQISLQFGLLLGVAVLVGLRFGGTWCLHTMGVAKDSELYIPAHDYLKTRAWAAPAVLFLVVAEGAFRGYGNTRVPLLASVVAAAINLALDPLLMLPPLRWGVTGAAAATAVSQYGAAGLYAIFLQRRRMLPAVQRRNKKSRRKESSSSSQQPQPPHYQVNTRQVIQTILGANVAMMAKQGSLLLAWAYATARATRLGAAHVAAHQIALSFWLVFALFLDGAAVSAQVLMGRASAASGSFAEVRSLTRYMFRFATLQGLASSILIWLSGNVVTHLFTPDETIRHYVTQLIPHLAGQQVLISLTLVLESLAAGGHQFNTLAVGTTLSTILAVSQLRHATSITSIWSRGILTLFLGRFVTAVLGSARVYGVWNSKKKKSSEPEVPEDYSI